MKDAEHSTALGEMGLNGFAPYLMNRIMGRYNADLRQVLDGLDLSTPKARALAVLSAIDGLLVSELSVYTVTEQSTLSRALDQLQQAGLIRRETDAEDGRKVRIYISASGRAAFEAFWPAMASAEAKMFQGIPEAERRAFVATLQTMLANIRHHEF